MSDVLNCDGMTAEQARAALRAHCRAQEAARTAERDKRAEHLRANAERLGWVVGHPPARPKKFPVRVGQRPEIRFNGRRALVARWQDAFIGFDSGHPVKRLTFEIVAGRYDCFRVTAILEDEDLTPETYWLSGCDVLEVTTGGAIRFCSGYELAARDGAAAFAVQAIPEPEVATARHLLKAAAALQQADAAPASSKPKTKQRQAVTQSDRTKWTLQALEKVAAIWVAWRRNHNTHKMGGRERDCFEKHKDTLPVCIKTAKDFQNCKECARKHGLIPKHNRKRRKSAG